MATKKRIQPKKVDWPKVKAWYMSDASRSYSQAAKKFGLTKRGLQERATREKWPEIRQNLAEKAYAEFEKKLLDEKSKMLERHLQLSQNIQALASKAIMDIDKASKSGKKPSGLELKRLVDTLKTTIEIERLTVGMPTNMNAITDADGSSWSGFSDMVKAARKVNESEQSKSDIGTAGGK